jgi:3-oxoacyl-[acyl-carrier protein] reductase
VAVAADVTKRSEVERLVQTALDRLRASGHRRKQLRHLSVRQDRRDNRRTLSEAVRSQRPGAPLLVAAAAAPHLGSGGSIINISSNVTRVFPAESAIYTGTKGAVDAITGVLAQELGPRGIRVNAVNPGLIETDGTHAAGVIGSEFQTWNESRTPLGRIGQVRDIAPIVSYLASDDAGWVTGEIILGSGGMR